MTIPGERRILTINTGSSSLKAALHVAQAENITAAASALADRIGLAGGRLQVFDAAGRQVSAAEGDFPNHGAALRAAFRALAGGGLDAIGHRVVHGGERYSRPAPVDRDLLQTLRDLIPIDPMHLPQAVETIELAMELAPRVPQVACFDTAFHRAMPRVAQLFALPRELAQEGIVRYGFHGLSYEYLVERLRQLYGPAAGGKVVAAHLGNGASLAAIDRGRAVDTTMGFTPTGGLMMGTRSGDLDPGVLLHLAATRQLTADGLADLVNRRSGLLGVSGLSSDMRELLQAAAVNPAAEEAVELFCYQACKFIGALAAVLGGLDTLVFTGGIGQHAAPVRRRICGRFEFLGLRLDEERNDAHAEVISAAGSRVTVRVIPTDEDLIIAHHTFALLWT